MNILAIDPGIANTGIAYQKGETVCYRTIVTQSGDPFSERIKEVLYEIDRFTTETWDWVIIEDFVGHLGRNTVFLIGALLGLQDASSSVLIHPKKWVRQFFGKKEDYKKAAMRWCLKNGRKPRTQHEADALCLLEWGKRYAV